MLEASYPVPYQRINQTQPMIKRELGFMNDGTGCNPSNPNNIINLKNTRNSIYNIRIKGVPDVR